MKPVKFCGIQRLEEIELINTLPAAAVGFIFYPPSFRAISPETATTLRQALRPDIRAVGVFVNESPEVIADLADRNIIDVIQLHGQEDSGYIEHLRSICSLPIIQAFAIRSKEDLKKAETSMADAILVDAPAPGSGVCFDWNLLKTLDRSYILAGGLNPDNAAAAAELKGAVMLDVSSGIETDRTKDPEKMRAFIRALSET